MAGYACGLCDPPEQATILITPLTGGETMAIGEGCMSVAFTGMLAGHLGIDAEKLWAACERLVKAEARKAAVRADPHGADGQQESVFVRVPHGTPDDDAGAGGE